MKSKKTTQKTFLQYKYLGAQIASCWRALISFYDSKLSSINLTLSQSLQIIEIDKFGGSTHLSNLARRLSMDRTTLSRMSHILLEKGYIVSEFNNTDKRQRLLILTEIGKNKAKDALTMLDAIDKELANDFGVSKFKDICELLESLRGLVYKKPPL